MKRQAKWHYAILILLMVIACGMTFYTNLAYHYEMRGEVTELLYSDMEIVRYDVVSENGGSGKTFTVLGEDPQFILTLSQEYAARNIGGIELQFDETWNGEEPLPVQVFYAEADELFSERHSSKSILKKGENTLLIPIPLGRYQTIRFDIDGDFKLAGIQGCSETMAKYAYVAQDTIEICIWYFPVIIIGFSLIFWAHRVQIKRGGFTAKSYAKSIFLGAEPSSDHETYLDWLRILAVVLVILAHSCSPAIDQTDTAWKRLILVCGVSLGLCSNLLYVMISGILLLGNSKRNEESIMIFYVRRVSKVIIPLVVYGLLLLRINNEVHFFPPHNIGTSLKRIVAGGIDCAPHFWLIYIIVALYFAAPFFRVMVQNMSDRFLFSLAAVILILNALTVYLPLFGMEFGAKSFLAGWEGVFLLGYILKRQNSLAGAARRNHALMFSAIAAYIVMVAVAYTDYTQMNYVYGCTPVIVIASCGIFALFLNHKEKLNKRSNMLVRLFSKYSYSMILIHWYALFVVVEGKFHITALRFGCIGGIVASVAVTLVVSVVLSILFDNTVVILCKVLFEKLTSKIMDIGGRRVENRD